MDPLLMSVLFAVGGYALRHFLPFSSSKPPVLPTTFGHGELIKYLLQLLANSQTSPVPVPSPSQPTSVDLHQVLMQLLALLEKALIPPSSPLGPVPK